MILEDTDEVHIVTYQTVTGTLSPGAHPGSYNGQDAWNDMLVTGEEYVEEDDRLLRGGVKPPKP